MLIVKLDQEFYYDILILIFIFCVKSTLFYHVLLDQPFNSFVCFTSIPIPALTPKRCHNIGEYLLNVFNILQRATPPDALQIW